MEKKPETEKAADGAKGEPMETDTSGKEANSGDKMETEEKKDEGDAPGATIYKIIIYIFI